MQQDPAPQTVFPPTIPGQSQSPLMSPPAGPAMAQPTPPAPPKTKSRKKLLFIILLILIVAGGAAAYFLAKSNPNQPSSSVSSSAAKGISLVTTEKAGSNKNVSSVNLAVGYVKYDKAKLKPLPSAPPSVGAISTVAAPAAINDYSSTAFFQTNNSTYDQSLTMYDFGTKTFYTVDEETGLVRNFYNPVILSDHYIAFYLLTQKDPVTLEGSVVVVDLLTGAKTTLIDDTAANLPWSSCCSVSPDGLHLAMPVPPNKLEVYTAGNQKVQTLTTTAKFVPDTSGQNNDSYGQAVRGIGYPKISWVDNNSVLLAMGASLSYTVSGGDTHIAPAKNGLGTLDLQTGKLTPLTGTDQYEITWFGLSSNKKLAFTSYVPSEDLSGGPATGTVSLYTMDFGGSAAPQAIPNMTHDMLGAIVMDAPSNLLYLQDSSSAPIQTVDLSKVALGKTYDAKGSLIEGVYSPTVLISGNRDATLPSTQLNLLDLTTGALTKLY